MLKLISCNNVICISYISFNTSHVKVNRKRGIKEWIKIKVSIHPMLKLITSRIHTIMVCKLSFNTSHVKVNPGEFIQGVRCMEVSIHPMLKLIQRISCIPYNTLYQIPQYLSTFLKFLPATAPFAKKIYKITAMPLFLRIHAILH